MPIPVFVVSFHRQFGRWPEPDEIPFPVRVSLERCIVSNQISGWSKADINRQKKMLGHPVVIPGGRTHGLRGAKNGTKRFRPQLVGR